MRTHGRGVPDGRAQIPDTAASKTVEKAESVGALLSPPLSLAPLSPLPSEDWTKLIGLLSVCERELRKSLSGACYCYYAARSAQMRVKWVKAYATNEERLNKALADQKRLMYGDLNEVVQAEEPFRALRHRVARVLVDRGRVWRNCVPAGVQPDGSIGLNVIAASASPELVPDLPPYPSRQQLDTLPSK